MTSLAVLIVAAIVLSGLFEVYLSYRHVASVSANQDEVPEGFAGAVSGEEHRRAAAYTLARTRLSIAKTIFDTVLSVVWLTLWLGPLYDFVALFIAPGMSRGVAIVVLFALIERLLHLPFSIFSTFALETRFGFNRATPAMFFLDRIKGLVLAFVFGVPLLYGFFFLLRVLPDFWWLAGWAGLMALMIAMTVIYPAFIAPLFNKFEPLPQAPLKTRIEALLAKCGFESKGLYVMDASRRSTHGNAYFTGFGKAKRIVFFDTLLQNHTPDEILSILAHELGHYKLGHIGQRIAESAILTLLGFGVLYWAFASGVTESVRPPSRSGFGFDSHSDRPRPRHACDFAADELSLPAGRISGRRFRQGDGGSRADDQRLDPAFPRQSLDPHPGPAVRLVLLFAPAGAGADCPAQSRLTREIFPSLSPSDRAAAHCAS